MMRRIDREKRVIKNMIRIYCHHHHAITNNSLCPECATLLDYCLHRIEHCCKGSAKTSCRKCEIHCYSQARREEIKKVMRYVGPRMIFIHPIDAVLHLISEMK